MKYSHIKAGFHQIAKKYYVCLLISVLVFAGCKTTNTPQVLYKKEYSRYVNDVAILYYPESPQMDVDIRSDEMFVSRLVAGPNPIAQLFMRLAQNSANQEDIAALNEVIFDLNIGEVLCERLNTKFQLCSYFHVVPQESIVRNKTVWNLLEKHDKDSMDYGKIGIELGVDTILEVDIISYGLKDPGIFSDPYAFIQLGVKMATTQGTVIWRDVVEVKKALGMDAQEFLDFVYTVPEYLQGHLLKVTDAVSESCVEKLGFDTHNTYLLEEDYIKRTKYKINIAEKLNELNVLRHENLISSTDYDKTKLDLIDKAKGIKDAGQGEETKLSATAIQIQK